MDSITTKSQKKKLLIDILNAINPYRDLAEGFLLIIKGTDDENLIDNLLIEIQKGIKSIKSKREREKIRIKIKEINKEINKKTQEDKENAEKLLEDFINNI